MAVIRVENESQWNTEDLKAIVDRVAAIETKAMDRVVNGHHDFVVHFKTRRSGHYGNGRKRAASLGYNRGVRLDFGRTIDLYSKAQLTEKNALERMVQSTCADVRQDIAPYHIRDIAQAVRAAIMGDYVVKEDGEASYEWAEKVQLRSLSKIAKSDYIARLRLESLESRKQYVTRRFNREVARLDSQIQQLRKKNDLPA